MSMMHLTPGFATEISETLGSLITKGQLEALKALAIPPNDVYLYIPFGCLYQTCLEQAIYARQLPIIKYLTFEVGVDVCHPLAPKGTIGMFNALDLARRNLDIFEQTPSLHADLFRRDALKKIIDLLTVATDKQKKEAYQAEYQAALIWDERLQEITHATYKKILPKDLTGARFALTETLLLAYLRSYQYAKTQKIFKHSIAPNRRGFAIALRSLACYLRNPLLLNEHSANLLVGAIITVRDIINDSHRNRTLSYRKDSAFSEYLSQLLLRLGVESVDEKTFKGFFQQSFGPMPDFNLFL